MINAGLSTVEIDIDAVDNYDNDDDQCHVAPDLKGSEADLNDGSKSFPFIALFHHVLISQSLSLSLSVSEINVVGRHSPSNQDGWVIGIC